MTSLALQSTESFIQMMQYCLHTLEGKSAYKITESERLSKILNFVILKIMNFLVVTVAVGGGGWEVMSFNSNYTPRERSSGGVYRNHFVCPSVCLSVCLSVRLSVRPSVRPSVRLSVQIRVRPITFLWFDIGLPYLAH